MLLSPEGAGEEMVPVELLQLGSSDIYSGCWTQGREIHNGPLIPGDLREMGSGLPHPREP